MSKRISSLLLFALSVNCLLAQDNGSLFVNAAHERLQNAKAYTLEVADLMPAEKYTYQPTEGQMTYSEQLIHLSSNLRRLSYKVSNLPDPPAPLNPFLADKDSIRAVLDESYDYALAIFENYNTNQLADTVDFFAGPKSKLQIINLINDHQTHHRGQLMVYLRLQGIMPPRYVGW